MEQISEVSGSGAGQSSYKIASTSSAGAAAAGGGGGGQGAGAWLSGTVTANVVRFQNVQHGSKELTVYQVQVVDESGEWQVVRR
jgi:hypothetical protein